MRKEKQKMTTMHISPTKKGNYNAYVHSLHALHKVKTNAPCENHTCPSIWDPVTTTKKSIRFL